MNGKIYRLRMIGGCRHERLAVGFQAEHSKETERGMGLFH